MFDNVIVQLLSGLHRPHQSCLPLTDDQLMMVNSNQVPTLSKPLSHGVCKVCRNHVSNANNRQSA